MTGIPRPGEGGPDADDGPVAPERTIGDRRRATRPRGGRSGCSTARSRRSSGPLGSSLSCRGGCEPRSGTGAGRRTRGRGPGWSSGAPSSARSVADHAAPGARLEPRRVDPHPVEARRRGGGQDVRPERLAGERGGPVGRPALDRAVAPAQRRGVEVAAQQLVLGRVGGDLIADRRVRIALGERDVGELEDARAGRQPRLDRRARMRRRSATGAPWRRRAGTSIRWSARRRRTTSTATSASAARARPWRRARSRTASASSSTARRAGTRNAISTEMRFQARMSGVRKNSIRLERPPTVPTASAIRTPDAGVARTAAAPPNPRAQHRSGPQRAHSASHANPTVPTAPRLA